MNLKDPKIENNGNQITLSANYWNYSFVANFFPLLVFIYILPQRTDMTIKAICILAIGGMIISILVQLDYYNTLIIDKARRILTVKPNRISGLIKIEKMISFTEIRKIDFKSSATAPSFERYILILTLKDSKQLKLISTKDKDDARKLSKNLSLFVA
jgi:hypothetical protein